MTVRVEVAPELLFWAIERAGWDDETTMRRAPRLTDWATGIRKPTLKQLEKFASDTHTPFGLLFLSEAPVEEVPIRDLRTLGNVAVPQPSADMLDTIYMCQTRQDWYRTYAQEVGMGGPDFVSSVTTQISPELVAAEIRAKLDFEVTARATFARSDALRRILIDRIENLGVLVMVNGIVGSNTHRKLNPDEFRGFALADRLAPLIFVNGVDTMSAQIFTLFHELGHIWLGKSALSDAALASEHGNSEELWCNRVAAEVLVPSTSLRAEYRGDLEVSELERLAKFYRASTLVVLKQIYDAGLLPWGKFQERYTDERARILDILAKSAPRSSGGDYYKTQPLRLSRSFVQAVISSTLEGTTTYRDAYQLIGTKKHSTFENLASKLGVS